MTSIHLTLNLPLQRNHCPCSCRFPQSSVYIASLNICNAVARPSSCLPYPPLLEALELQAFNSFQNLSGRWNTGITFHRDPARPSLPNSSDASVHTYNSGALMRARTSLGRDNGHFSSLIRDSGKVGQHFIWKLC